MPPEQAGQPLLFEQPLPLRPRRWRRWRPRSSGPASTSACGATVRTLRVWGTTRDAARVCFVIEVVAPGLLVIKHRGETFGKFVNVAVLEGDQIKIVDEGDASVPDCPGAVEVAARLRRPQRAGVDGGRTCSCQLAASMRAHGRGGMLLVVPPDRDVAESIVHASALRREAAVCGAGRSRRRERRQRAPIGRRICAARSTRLPGLTAVDGATILNDQLRAARVRREDRAARAASRRSNACRSPSRSKAARWRGHARRSSAARATCRPRSSSTISATRCALVASQDGRFTDLHVVTARGSCTRIGSRRCCSKDGAPYCPRNIGRSSLRRMAPLEGWSCRA